MEFIPNINLFPDGFFTKFNSFNVFGKIRNLIGLLRRQYNWEIHESNLEKSFETPQWENFAVVFHHLEVLCLSIYSYIYINEVTSKIGVFLVNEQYIGPLRCFQQWMEERNNLPWRCHDLTKPQIYLQSPQNREHWEQISQRGKRWKTMRTKVSTSQYFLFRRKVLKRKNPKVMILGKK